MPVGLRKFGRANPYTYVRHSLPRQAEPAPRDPRGGGFDPGDAAAFAAASAPSLPGGGGGGGDDDDGGGGGGGGGVYM